MNPADDPPPLPDLPGDDPSGPNLEFDPDFGELERLAQGKPEQQYGNTIVPAEEPDWKAVEAAAAALADRSYDLRILSHLAVARLHRGGIAGFAETMQVIRGLLDDRWETLHPQLDPEDDNDPTLRANALLALTHPVRVLRLLRTMPLARSARAGSVSWRDIGIANGSIEVPENTPKLGDGVIAAAFRESDPEQLAQLRTTIDRIVACAVAIPAIFDDKGGTGSGPDYADLVKLGREIAAIMIRHQATAPAETSEEVSVDLPSPAAAEIPARPAAMFSIATMTAPTNRADALRLLELVIEFYEQHEPSSPLPLLIARARRLAEMGFMDILRDMAPDGVSQAERVAGTPVS